eukprot:gnl/TRDRNA2_/TRDRNA2_199560_c0_seq1.p1 gnl/TRDRNA2_/TRDRNA2_199560_c0~~gnl/TRDRNA2_/TRDRNA2_199560_c0_seq1.p1  ORF type:complete len:459 (-),score=86.83 gnl/TRDRNA2_/TRDRNA2_199560_c0_seq1:57-1433(-)
MAAAAGESGSKPPNAEGADEEEKYWPGTSPGEKAREPEKDGKIRSDNLEEANLMVALAASEQEGKKGEPDVEWVDVGEPPAKAKTGEATSQGPTPAGSGKGPSDMGELDVTRSAASTGPSSGGGKSSSWKGPPATVQTHAPTKSKPYKTRETMFQGERRRIVLQDEKNGPCPLIVLYNFLSLSGCLGKGSASAKAKSKTEQSGDELVAVILGHLQDEASRSLDASCEDEAFLSDTMALFDKAAEEIPKLELGVNVNIGFAYCSDFAGDSPGLAPFRALGVPLRHGWLPDPSDKRLVELIGGKSYDEVADTVAMAGADPGADVARIRTFLERTIGQLTDHGLSELYQSVADRDLAVLYRNDHFSLLYKNNGLLYTLVTDESLVAAGEERRGSGSISWMTLTNVYGDEAFVDDFMRETREVEPERAVRVRARPGRGGTSAPPRRQSEKPPKECCDDCSIL